MTSMESPAVARRRLRLTLRSLRDDRGMTQAQVAEALDWSLSKVNRIEGGDVTISKNDLTALLSHYDVRDDELVARLVEESRASRRRGWWTEPHLREHLTPATVRLLQFEAEATLIRCFQPTAIPGMFQTPAYAAAIMGFWSGELSEETRSARLEIRSNRAKHFFEGPNSPHYLLILDESVIWRQFGGTRVMVEQLQALLDHIERGRLSVRILLLAEPGVDAFIGPFITIDLDDENAVLYREAQAVDDVVEDVDEVHRHRRIFDQMWQSGLQEDASVRLITARAAAMLASLDHPGRG